MIASGNTATQNLSLAVAGTDDHLIIDPKSGNLIVVPDDVHQGEANLDTRVSQATGKPTPIPTTRTSRAARCPTPVHPGDRR